MEIPYTVSTRPDTGLWNAKVGIWLFLASEVMLFGGLFSAYIFLRLDAPPGVWPHGLLNVPVGTMNTAILIMSSVTVVLAWAALKMRRYRAYWWYMLATISCGVIFLVVKLAYEWPQKFDHFGAYIKPEALGKYEQYLGNEYAAAKGLPPRLEITGHLHDRAALNDPKIKEYEVALDPLNAEPTNPVMDRPHFFPLPVTDKIATIEKEDVERATMFLPTHSAYFASYFTRPQGIRGIRARHTKTRQRLFDGGRAPAHIHRRHGRSFLCRFRNAESQHRHRHAGGDVESGSRRRRFHASCRGKAAHLPHPDFYRLFCAGTFLAYIFGVVRLSGLPLNVA